MTNTEFEKKYSPSTFEEKLYTHWEESGLFKPRKSLT